MTRIKQGNHLSREVKKPKKWSEMSGFKNKKFILKNLYLLLLKPLKNT